MAELRLTKGAENDLFDHYSGNCVSCARCTFYERIQAGEPGAVAAYVEYMKEEHGRTVKTRNK